MWPLSLAPERRSLHDTEAVLFVDHCQSEIRDVHLVLNHGVGPDDDVDLARGDTLVQRRLRLFGPAAGEQGDLQGTLQVVGLD